METLEWDLKRRLADAFALLGAGESLGMPLSRPMPSVAHGVQELRVKDRTGAYRVFYDTKIKEAILVFHLFQKKTQATPTREIHLALKRLKEMI